MARPRRLIPRDNVPSRRPDFKTRARRIGLYASSSSSRDGERHRGLPGNARRYVSTSVNRLARGRLPFRRLGIQETIDSPYRQPCSTMSPSPYVAPIVDSTSVFKADIFKGKVIFVTGGGSGICKVMTEAMVCAPSHKSRVRWFTRPSIDASWCRCSDSRSQVSLHRGHKCRFHI